MNLIQTLDLLEEYLTETSNLHKSFSRAHFLLARFRINWGEAGIELLLHDLLKAKDSEAGDGFDSETVETDTSTPQTLEIRHRLPSESNQIPTEIDPSSSLLTKHQQINSLKSLNAQIYRNRLLPLARLKQSLEESLRDLQNTQVNKSFY